MALEQELVTFQQELATMLSKGWQGKYVLIRGSDVDGPWPTENEAYREGRRRFGMTPFMVRQVQAEESSFGILRHPMRKW